MDNISADPRYIQGKKFLDNRNFEEAIAMFAALTEACVEKYGEMSLESARAYYEYGNALLTQEEENPKDGPIFNADEPEQTEATESKADNEDNYIDVGKADAEEGANEDPEEEGGSGGEEGEEEAADDLQVAWEVLDVARCILEKTTSCDKMLLSDVYMRLGDLLRYNENTAEAIMEYTKSLRIKRELCRDDDRKLSEIHYMLAVAHLSHARNGNGVAEKQAALKHYRDARRILDLHQQHAASAQSSDLESVKEILDELSETIESLEAEILEDTKAGQAASSSAAPEVGTTIGFGLPSSTAASSTLSATIGTKRSTAVDGPESNTAAPSTLQVKKKVKPDQQGNA